MQLKIDFKQQRFAVIGLGDTGLSIINYLQYQNAQIMRVLDTRANPPHQEHVQHLELHCGVLQGQLFDDIDIIVISPGISIYEPVLQQALTQGKTVINDIELFAQAISNWPSKVIGITGSNGKTTATSLCGFLGNIIGVNTLVAGNIGTPVLNSYLEIMQQDLVKPELIVLELSSFQLEAAHSLKLTAATVLNISEDHLDRYRDLLEYAYVKAHIFNNCQIQVLNMDDPLVLAMARSGLQTVYFGLKDSAKFNLLQVNNKVLLRDGELGLIYGAELELVGMHNYLNCLASLALLQAVGIDIHTQQIQQALAQFKGLEHRMQKVVVHNDITYIEDSKGTNVGAVVAGISGLNAPVNLILGGDGKGQDFAPLRALVQQKCRTVAIIGQDKVLINKVLGGLNLAIKNFETLAEAVQFCVQNAEKGDYVVLSPACASWDMFDNYKHRAQVFIDCVYDNIK